MSNSVDTRIVEMQFDNKQFESNAQTSIETLDKLKKSLDLEDSAKSFSKLDKAASSVNLDSLSHAAETVSSKFSVMGTVADQVLRRITDVVLNCTAKVKSFVEELTIKPVYTGFQEYETQINAIQTIMSNTRDKLTAQGYSEAERLDIVNDRLNTLNHYADKTIYNFTEMTRNIGTFTAAGVELDSAVNAIQGIANLGAISGSTSEQVNRGMYQMSQAISTGTVKLMDWNSIVNAGMGGEIFQKALTRTANAMGVTVDKTVKTVDASGKTVTTTVKRTASECIEAAGSFRDSLSDGWLTSDVLLATLEQFSWDFEEIAKNTILSDSQRESLISNLVERYMGDGLDYNAALKKAEALIGGAENLTVEGAKELKKAELLAQGYTLLEAEEIIALAEDATNAATKVKTFTQLFDTLKEAVQSGWTQTWTYIIGDFEEAKELLTGISDYFGNIIGESAEARNQLVKGWKDLGGRDEIITSFWNIVYVIQNVVGMIKGEFEKFFPPTTSEQLHSITQKFQDFTTSIKQFTESSEKMEPFRRIVAGVAAALNMVRNVLSWVWSGIGKLGDVAGSAASHLLQLAARVGDFFVNARTAITQSTTLQSILTKLGEATISVRNLFAKAFGKIREVLSELWTKLKESTIMQKAGAWLEDFVGKIPAAIQKLESWGAAIVNYVKNSETLQKIWFSVKTFFTSSIKTISDFSQKLKTAMTSFLGADTKEDDSIWEKLKARLSAGFSVFSDWFNETLVKLTEIWEKIKSAFSTFFGQTIPDFFNSLGDKVAGVIEKIDWNKICTAIGAIFAAVKTASFVRSIKKIGKGFDAIGEGFGNIGKSLKKLARDGLKITESKKDSFGNTFLKIAASIGILVAAMVVLSKMETTDILKSITVIGALGLELGILAGIFKAGGLDGKPFLQLAIGLALMIIPLKILAKMDTGAMLKGLAGIGAMLLELGVFMKLAGSGFTGKTAFLSLSISVNLLVLAMKQLTKLNVSEILKDIGALGVVLLELGLFTRFAGSNKIKGLISMAVALNLMVLAVRGFGKMNLNTLIKGILGVGSMVAAFAVVAKSMGSASLGKAVVMALTMAGMLVLFVGAFKHINNLNITSMLSFAGSFSVMLLALTVSMKLLGDMPISGALIGVANLAIIIAGIGGVIIGLGALKENWGGMTSFLNSGGEVLRQIGEALGKFVGGIGAGIVEGVDLPGVGTQLTDFMTNAQGFLEGAKTVDDSTREGIKNLSAAIIYISSAEFIKGLSQLLSFSTENPMSKFATDIAELGTGLRNFAIAVLPLTFVPKATLTMATTVATNLSTIYSNISGVIGLSTKKSFPNDMTTLGTALCNFCTQISNIDDEDFDEGKLETIKTIMTSLATLSTQIPSQGGLVQAITGVQSLAQFGTDVESFGTGIQTFITEISKVTKPLTADDIEKINTVIAIGTALSTLENGLEAQGGWADAIAGIKSLSTFGEGLPNFAVSLNTFIESVSGLKAEKYDQDKIDKAIAVAGAINQFEKTLPSTDGWAQSIMGTKDLSLFSTNIASLGGALATFTTNISGVDSGLTQNALDTMSLIDGFIGGLEETGGIGDRLKKWFSGSSDNTFLNTAQNMATVGENLNTFVTSITGLSFEGTIDSVSELMTNMDTFVSSLDPSGSIWEKLGSLFTTGDSGATLMKAASNASKFGTGLKALAEGISAASTLADEQFKDATKLFDDFTKFNTKMDEQGWSDNTRMFNDIGSSMVTFGGSLTGFMGSLASINTTDLFNVASAIASMVSAAQMSKDVDLADVANLRLILEEYASTDFSNAGTSFATNLIAAFATSIQNNQSQVSSSATQLSTSAVSALRSTYSAWVTAGQYLSSGLAKGITAASGAVRNAAAAVANGAVNAIKSRSTWDEHSPSRVGEDLGMNFDLGIANGISGYSNVVSSQTSGMGERAVEAAKAMLRGVNADVLSNLDPNPTIRPVLDLSNVQNGVNAIGGMFADDPMMNSGMFRGININRNAGMLNFDGAKILGGQSNKDVVNEIRELTNKFNNLSESVSNMKLVLDTGVLVGQTSAKMDSQLGVLAARKGRGN